MVTGPCLHTVGTRVGGGGGGGAPPPPDPYGDVHIAPLYEHSGERPHRLRA